MNNGTNNSINNIKSKEEITMNGVIKNAGKRMTEAQVAKMKELFPSYVPTTFKYQGEVTTETNAKGYTYVRIAGETVYIYGSRKNGVHVAITDNAIKTFPADVWGWEYHEKWSPKYATVMTAEKFEEFTHATGTYIGTIAEEN